MAEEISLRFPARLHYLHLATNLARQVCGLIKDRALDDDFHYDIPLCISEACTNAIKYGGSGEDATVFLRIRIASDRIVIRVSDQGTGFDLNRVPAPDFNLHPEGGYGIYIIRAKMDEVEYTPGVDENVLVMTKYLGSQSPERSRK